MQRRRLRGLGQDVYSALAAARTTCLQLLSRSHTSSKGFELDQLQSYMFKSFAALEPCMVNCHRADALSTAARGLTGCVAPANTTVDQIDVSEFVQGCEGFLCLHWRYMAHGCYTGVPGSHYATLPASRGCSHLAAMEHRPRF